MTKALSRIASAPTLFVVLMCQSALADDKPNITDPTSSPVETWVTNNQQSVAFGWANGYNYRIRIYNKDTPSTEYMSQYQLLGSNPAHLNFAVPSTGYHATPVTTTCTLEITIYSMGPNPTALGTSTVDVNIASQ